MSNTTADLHRILQGLNPQQVQAVETTEGPLLIVAGAGSGKTSVLTRRIAYLIHGKQVPPWGILAITFTNKAARELRERIESLVGVLAAEVWATTFHSMCVRILRKNIETLGYRTSFSILDDGDQLSAVRKILNSMNVDSKRYDPRAILSAISQHKNQLVTATKARDHALNLYDRLVGDVYLEYQRRLKLNESLDFDDLIMKTVELFHQHPEVLEDYQRRLQYLHVDEYQDTNHAQYQLVNLLARKHRNLCAVGDSDQSIYGWRGADIRNILQFEQDYPDAQIIRLEQNYRSTQTILEIANQVIRNNRQRKDKKLWTQGEEGEKAKLFQCVDERAEANFVADEIGRALDKGKSYADFTVLYRTNAQSRVIEEIFLQRGIPYRIFGGLKFYERKEIKDVLAYLRLIANPADDASLLRVINVPKRGIGDQTLGKVEDFARQYDITLYEGLQRIEEISVSPRIAKTILEFVQSVQGFVKMKGFVTVTDLVQELLKKTGYLLTLQAEKTLEAEARVENLEEFQSLTSEFDARWPGPGFQGALEEFLTDVALVADSDLNGGKPQAQEDVISANHVMMMTLHSAKGLEFPYVFMVGMEDGIFPHSRSLHSDDEMEEERRLCYVGVTRAKQQLYFTTCASRMIFGQTRSYIPSRFLSEIPKEYLEKVDIMRKTEVRSMWSARADSSGRGSLFKPASFGADLSVDYAPGDQVEHRKWGIGSIQSVSGTGEDLELTVLFEDPIGSRKLVARFAPIVKC